MALSSAPLTLLPPGLGTGHRWVRAGADCRPGGTCYLRSRSSRPNTTTSNSATLKASSRIETANRFIDTTSIRVVELWHWERGMNPPLSAGNQKMMKRTTAISVPISKASCVSARTALHSFLILRSKSSIGLSSFPLGCWYITLEFALIQVIYNRKFNKNITSFLVVSYSIL